ncbi:MAG: hypothetical protein LBV49_13665, partial [Azonexus sp.]|nr:hypothetical protein [Azonexus sp.]
MSIINQVLHDLEKRGAAEGQALAHPVASPPERRSLPILLGVLAISAALAAGWWWGTQRHATTPAPLPPAAEVTVTTAITPAVTPAAEAASLLPADPVASPAPVAESSAIAVTPPPAPPVAQETAVSAAAKAADGNLAPQLKIEPELKSSPIARAKPAPTVNVSTTPTAQTPTAAVAASAPPAPAPANDPPLKQISPQQQADAEFRRANEQIRAGHIAEATAGYETALRIDPNHDAARQALVVVLLNEKRNTEVERLLHERLARK